MDNSITKYDHKGITVAFNGRDKISLTDLWKASGKGEDYRPYKWSLLPESQRFIETVTKQNGGKSPITTVKGRTGGTWAHWQIWLAYAKYLSPELHMWANEVVKERIEEDRNPDLALERGNDRAIQGYLKQGKSMEWISRRLQAKTAFKVDNHILLERADNGMIFPLCADAVNKEILKVGARKWKKANGIPDKAATRDHLDEIQLLQIALATAVSGRDIEKADIRGNLACAMVHSDVARKIAQAVQ